MEMKAAASSPPPPSNSESQNSATQPIQPKREVDDAPTTNNSGAFDVFDQKPETKPPLTPEHFQSVLSLSFLFFLIFVYSLFNIFSQFSSNSFYLNFI